MLAASRDRPDKISTGKVKNDPPPAREFCSPAHRPAMSINLMNVKRFQQYVDWVTDTLLATGLLPQHMPRLSSFQYPRVMPKRTYSSVSMSLNESKIQPEFTTFAPALHLSALAKVWRSWSGIQSRLQRNVGPESSPLPRRHNAEGVD